MQKKSTKRKLTITTVLLITIIVAGWYLLLTNTGMLSSTETFVREHSTSTVSKVIDTESADEKSKREALEAIKTREEFQQQQALLAEEIYINEQRAELAERRTNTLDELSKERAALIAQLDEKEAQKTAELDAEKAGLDSQLENVRHGLVSFGSAPTLNE